MGLIIFLSVGFTINNRCGHIVKESSPYANYITSNFITAIFPKKIHKYLPYANFWLFYFISAIFGLFLPTHIRQIALIK